MRSSSSLSTFLLVGALLLFAGLAGWQLGLPGLHYDEAKEAGVNAMEILTGAPITAFRQSGITFAGRTFPVMVQDYIGALNVYLALPALAMSGIGVPNLRMQAVLTGWLALLFLALAVEEWLRREGKPEPQWRAGLWLALLLAASPSFVFWSRQGIFVTNLQQMWGYLALWQGLRWLRCGNRGSLWIAMAGAGLALYAKLQAIWLVGPAGGLLFWLWWRQGRRPALTWSTALGAALAFLLPLAPLVWFNVQTGGSLASVGNNLGTSYYGVDNTALLANLPVRLEQLASSLRGDQFWYLGGLFGNPAAPWLALALVAGALSVAPKRMAGPLLLLALMVAASLFTVSDLFITHYALIQPIAVATVAVAVALLVTAARSTRWPARMAVAAALLWLALDLAATLRYHGVLAQSGGLADHSDAGYQLAYHLQYNGLGSPIALDWGFDAPVRFLSGGTVTPVEIFGYGSPTAADDGYRERLGLFLDNPANIYLLHAESFTVFAGRREIFLAEVAARGLTASVEQRFAQRDGTPLIELWRVATP